MCGVGPRLETIKMASVAKALQKADDFEIVVLAAVQPRDLLDQAFVLFNIQADYDLKCDGSEKNTLKVDVWSYSEHG